MKKGFTLAEVLITLGIIGVVAALTAPALNSAVQKAKVPPILRKFIATMETVHEHILSDNEADVMSTAIGCGVAGQEANYYQNLAKYLKGTFDASPGSADKWNDATKYPIVPTLMPKGTQSGFAAQMAGSEGHVFHMDSGQDFIINILTEALHDLLVGVKGSYKGLWATTVVDVNGFATGPNKVGKDLFLFYIDDNGSVIPLGGKQEYDAYTGFTHVYRWKDGALSERCNDTDEVQEGWTCSGSIADNGWKIVYQY